MSRRRGEFEHRTSIFEGAFRAWSHLGGLDPVDLENKPASELDPLTNPIDNDPRLHAARKNGEGGNGAVNPDGSHRREYPYEPLPRSGLAHPYVQAILSPWLGPDADNEAIQLGLTTLRTWWQHRRKGESGSAIAALGTEKMKGVVEGYTRHFFTLAHCLIVNDKEQPPRSLHTKMKELEKMRKKGIKKRARDDLPGGGGASSSVGGSVSLGGIGVSVGGMLTGNNGAGAATGPGGIDPSLTASIQADLTDDTLSPLERLHAAQRRQLEEAGGLNVTQPIINIKGKCIPGKIDLPGVVDAVNRKATQLSHRGGGAIPNAISSSSGGGGDGPLAAASMDPSRPTSSSGGGGGGSEYGDPNTTPVVYVTGSGDNLVAMSVDGITCAHCVKIVETVLRGCNGNKSPIEGLLDAAADRVLCSVLIKIDRPSNAKRIAFEAARNLAMVGYTAKAKVMSIVCQGKMLDEANLSNAFEIVAGGDHGVLFDWKIACRCPDNGVLREDCKRHSQMSSQIFEAFDARRQLIADYVAGHGVKPSDKPPARQSQNRYQHDDSAAMPAPLNPFDDEPLQVDHNLDFGGFGMEPPSMPAVPRPKMAPQQNHPPTSISYSTTTGNGFGGGGQGQQGFPGGGLHGDPHQQQFQGEGIAGLRRSQLAARNPSILSYGGGLRNMSLASDATFGRAMSGLSALSIDWENLEDFDLEVDHSAHINNAATSPKPNVEVMGGPRRSSLRRSFMSTGDKDRDSHVSFKV